jgi:hypothetical protein
MGGSTNSGGAMLGVNNIYTPLNTPLCRFWDQGQGMKDELDGIDLRLNATADSIEIGCRAKPAPVIIPPPPSVSPDAWIPVSQISECTITECQ